ncbi:MAG: hypothetical protein ACK5Q5_02930 [Planctomycetaceae bacterium]
MPRYVRIVALIALLLPILYLSVVLCLVIALHAQWISVDTFMYSWVGDVFGRPINHYISAGWPGSSFIEWLFGWASQWGQTLRST